MANTCVVFLTNKASLPLANSNVWFTGRALEIGFGSSQDYACICQRRPSDDSETKTRDSETKTRESETKTDESETKARESQTKAEY